MALGRRGGHPARRQEGRAPAEVRGAPADPPVLQAADPRLAASFQGMQSACLSARKHSIKGPVTPSLNHMTPALCHFVTLPLTVFSSM